MLDSKKQSSKDWSPEAMFAVVVESAVLNEAELSEYCRKKGLYSEQIKAWKTACINANQVDTERRAQEQATSKRDKKRIKALEKDLRHKEKALAETAALLVLRKKLNALWEEDGAD